MPQTGAWSSIEPHSMFLILKAIDQKKKNWRFAVSKGGIKHILIWFPVLGSMWPWYVRFEDNKLRSKLIKVGCSFLGSSSRLCVAVKTRLFGREAVENFTARGPVLNTKLGVPWKKKKINLLITWVMLHSIQLYNFNMI